MSGRKSTPCLNPAAPKPKSSPDVVGTPMHIITSIASACATMNGQMPVTILTMFWKYYSSVFCDIVMVESIVDTKTVLSL